MANITQILTDWTTASGAGKVTVMYFDGATSITTQRTALTTFWQAVDDALDDSVTWAIRNAGVVVDDGSGTLTGSWSSGSVVSGVGLGVTEPLPDATQTLIRWNTPNIVNGRFLRGRTYVPGLSSLNVDEGNVRAAAITLIGAAATALVGSGAGLRVWHRPIAGSGGASFSATSAAVWPEFAVLRRRRN